MKRIQTVVITILIAAGLWLLLNRQPPSNEPTSAQDSTDLQQSTVEAVPPTESPQPETQTAVDSIPPLEPTPKSQTVETEVALPPLKPLTEQEVAERRKSIRTTLSALYTAQTAYFAEYDRYSSDLGHIGYLPAEGTIKARFGFLEPYTPSGGLNSNEDPTRSSSDSFTTLRDEDGEAVYQYDEYSQRASLAKYERFCDNRCSVTADQFEIISAVNLDGDETLDVWIVDSRKNIRHVVDDTKE